MNKGITILILFVVLGAMGLVFYSHTRQPAQAPAVPAEPARDGLVQPAGPLAGGSAPSGPAVGGQTGGSPLKSPQDGSGGLKQIDPPLTSTQPGTDGIPAPVRLTAGNTGVQTPPPVAPPAASDGPPALPAASDSAASGPDASGRGVAGKPPSGSPELTPWGTPSATPAGKQAEADRPAAPAGGADAGKSPAGGTAPQGRDSGKTPAAATPPAKEPVLSDKDSHALRDIGLHFAGQAMQLRIEADSPFPCRTFVLNNPDRLVIDLPGTWKGVKAPAVPQNRLVKAIRVGSQPSGPRIVLDLSAAPKGHKLQRNGNVVEIVVQ